jgi:Tol biopolymer transport system component/DNA-binding winged helix-turn-helix (wHTH) protein
MYWIPGVKSSPAWVKVMEAPPSFGRRVRAGLFEVDLGSGEVHKNGRKVPLQEQPFRVLAMLVERPGEIVTREELQASLWPADTFVGFDEGINTAIRKLRVVFGDSADNPRFIETIPRRGYRFIAPAVTSDSPATQLPTAAAEAAEASCALGTAELPILETQPAHYLDNRTVVGRTVLFYGDVERLGAHRVARKRHVVLAGCSVAVLLVALFIFRGLPPLSSPRALRTTQLTHFAHASGLGGITSDGARIFFLAREGGRWNLMQVPMSGGESQPFPSPFRSAIIMDVSPDRSEFLLASFTDRSGPFEFWTLPVVGGSPRRLSNMTGFGAFSPDGQQIAYHNTDGIYLCSRTGSDAHRLVSLPHRSWGLAWSPDGKTLRFTVEDETTDALSLWEVSADGSNLQPLLSGWHQPPNEYGGRWSADGRYYIFLSTQGEGQSADHSVWARREKTGFPLWSKAGAPVRLTAGPIGFGALAPSKDGRRLLAIGGGTRDQVELLRSTPDRKQFFPMIKLGEVFGANLAPKGDWLALVLPVTHSWTLWRSRPDGTERTQLASDFPGGVDVPRWSPDGTKIVFQGIREGHPWNIYVVPAKGGTTEELLPNDQAHEFPDWSADGESVVYYTPRASQAAPSEDSGIFVQDLKTRKVTRVPGSDGLKNPRTSFGGRYLAALTEDQTKVMLFDFQTRDWREIASNGKLFYFLEPTPDGKWLYFQDLLEAGAPLYRVRAGNGKPERVMSFESLLQTGVTRCRFMGLTRDGSPMVLATRGGGDVYALDLDLP